MPKALISSVDQTWTTPQPVFDRLNCIFDFKLDPCAMPDTAKCATYFTPETDGLKQSWHMYGNAFVNPPFGREISLWVAKSYEESMKGIVVVMLIPARPDTRYWHDYVFRYASVICFVKGRLCFGNNGHIRQINARVGAPFPSAIIVFGKIGVMEPSALQYFGAVLKGGGA